MVEILISSKRLTFVGDFCVHRSTLFPNLLRVDAQREHDQICNIQSRGKSLAIGESNSYFFVISPPIN